MSDVIDQVWPHIEVARDWGALLFAAIAALAAAAARRQMARQLRVFVDGEVEAIGARTRRITLRVRNHTLKEIRLREIAVRRPTPAVLAMDGGAARAEPLVLNHIFPPMDRGVVVLMMGTPAALDRPLQLKLRYGVGRRSWPLKTRLVRIEQDARLASLEDREAVREDDLLRPEPAPESPRGPTAAARLRP